MVLFEHVKKVYPDGTVAVDDLNLEIAQGEIVVLIGPSGCGKTTTLKMVNRIETHSSGKITIGGEDISTIDTIQLRRNTGYVIQEIALMPHMSVAENIAIVPKLLGWKSRRIKDRVDELLEMVGLPPDEYRHCLPEQLSGGEKQRIGVLRAMATDPPVVLMDEPFGALDPITREKLQNDFLEFHNTVKKTIVFVTHDMQEAMKMADRIVIMRRGRVEQIGTPEDLQHNPKNDFVQQFIGEDLLLKISPEAPVHTLLRKPGLTVDPGANAEDVLDQLADLGRETAQIVDTSNRWHGMTHLPLLKKASKQKESVMSAAFLNRKLFADEANLRDAAEMLTDQDIPIPVLERDGSFLGVVTLGGMARMTISRLTSGNREADQC